MTSNGQECDAYSGNVLFFLAESSPVPGTTVEFTTTVSKAPLKGSSDFDGQPTALALMCIGFDLSRISMHFVLDIFAISNVLNSMDWTFVSLVNGSGSYLKHFPR